MPASRSKDAPVAVGETQHEPVARPILLALRPVMLAGREELLSALRDRLNEGDAAWPRIVALHGLGGSGKTSVAVEYAHRQLPTGGIVWQLPAQDLTVLAAGFSRLATQLGASISPVVHPDPVAWVHTALANTDVPWLLLFDNAEDQESVRAFLPPVGNGQVLITSQSALWPSGQAVEVPVLEAQVAAGFLTARTGDHDEQSAALLAVELGGLPLALEQAAAYVQATGISLVRYLALFRQCRPDLLARGQPTGYNKTVATTWALALTQLQHDTPQALDLLRLLAFYAPEPVPLTLLLQPWISPGDEVTANDAIAALRRYSLITFAGEGMVQVHRLVQAVTQDHMSTDIANKWKRGAADLVEAAIPADPDAPESWPVCAVLLAHAQAVLPVYSSGMARIANYLGFSGSFALACDLWKKIADASERIAGPEDPETLSAQSYLASWTGYAGDPARARDQFKELLPIVERILGSEDKTTLTLRADLAFWTGKAGDPAGARDQYATLLPVIRRVLGDDHSEALTVRANLASWTGKAGDPAAARDEYAEIVPIRERVDGPEEGRTIGARANLAWYTGEAGDPEKARDQYAALIPVVKRVWGPEHPDTLELQADLARWIGEAGDPARARDQYAALLPDVGQTLGADHPITLRVRVGLAHWTGEAGDAAGACDQYAALLPDAERTWGPNHPDTLAAHRELSRWCRPTDPMD